MLTYELERKETTMRVRLSGRIDNEGAAVFGSALDRAFLANPQRAALDLSQVAFINSAGIGKLLSFYKRMRNRDAEIRIEGINDDVFTMFKAIRLDKLIPIEK